MQTTYLPSTERHNRLSNIITTLLRIALVGISSEDEEPRTASFELLSAICTYLDFEGRPAVPSKGVYTTGHPGHFLVLVCEGLAGHAPHLTMDFISEIAGNIAKMDIFMRSNCLQYLGPWIKNLTLFTDPCSKLYEPSGTRFRDCIRMLIDLTTAEIEVCRYFFSIGSSYQRFLCSCTPSSRSSSGQKLESSSPTLSTSFWMSSCALRSMVGWDLHDARRLQTP